MSRAWLGLGANIGDPPAQLAKAVTLLDVHPDIGVTKQSSVIVTRPWGKTDQPDFYNMVLEIETVLSPEALLDVCLATEAALGRVRLEHWGPRLIDIDILAFEHLEFSSPRLTIPHPHAQERAFVLQPLREIAPEVAEWIVRRRTD